MLNLENMINLLLMLLTAFAWWGLDRKWGVSVYHFGDRWTSKDCEAEKKGVGFIAGQKGKFKFGVALCIAAFQTFLILFFLSVPFYKVIVIFFEQTIVLYAGFYLGPWAYTLWKSANKVFEVVDQVEDGTIDIAGGAHKYIDTAKEQIAKTAHELKNEADELVAETANRFKREEKKPEQDEKPEAEKKQKETSMSMADFLEKHR